MPIPVDPHAFYSIQEIADMFDMPADALKAALSSHEHRLRAARIGRDALVRGDHLLDYLEALIPEEPTAFEEMPESIRKEEPGPVASGLLAPGEVDSSVPKVVGRVVRKGNLKPPPPSPPAQSAPAAAPPAMQPLTSGLDMVAPPDTRPVATPQGLSEELSGGAPQRRGPIGAPPPSDDDNDFDANPGSPDRSAAEASSSSGDDFERGAAPPASGRKKPLNYDVDDLIRQAEDLGSQPLPQQREERPPARQAPPAPRPPDSKPSDGGSDPSDISHWM